MIKKNLSGISKKSKMIAATAFVLGLTAIGGGVVSAASTKDATNAHNPMSALVSAVATKFNLNPADVQTVVDEVMKTQHAEMGAKMQADFASRLAEAVTAGKLTQVQANLITAKVAELKSGMEADRASDQTLTQEQRKAKMEAKRASLKEWATANGLPEEYIKFIGGGGKGFGGHGGLRPAKTQ